MAALQEAVMGAGAAQSAQAAAAGASRAAGAAAAGPAAAERGALALPGALSMHLQNAAAALAAVAGGGGAGAGFVFAGSPAASGLDWEGRLPLPPVTPPANVTATADAEQQLAREEKEAAAAAAVIFEALDEEPAHLPLATAGADSDGAGDEDGHGMGEGNGGDAALNVSDERRFVNIGSWRHSQPTEPNRLAGNSDPPNGLAGDAALFVVVRHGRLTLADGRPFRIAGLDAPQLMAWASQPGGRRQARQLLSAAARMGLNAVRFFAFADGADQVGALQVAPGILDLHAMRDGLDWVVAAARRYRLRLIPVLTDGSSNRYGGMWQYIRWINSGDTVTAFYSNDTYKALFFDYMTALATRNNSYTGMAHRHDPTILGWDLANRPRDPGSVQSASLQMLRELDLSAAHLAPDDWLLCGPECRLRWAAGWVGAHLRDALRAQKPLLLIVHPGEPRPAEPAAQPPQRPSAQSLAEAAYRRQLLASVFSAMEAADAAGLPVAGTLVSSPFLDWGTSLSEEDTTANSTQTSNQMAAAEGGQSLTVKGACSQIQPPELAAGPGRQSRGTHGSLCSLSSWSGGAS
ncbi:hypothetical protein GPECTOR_1g92 [Gonium pectorale]|uniref:mannan endo-1,4-beta-mannosidase n=1 Tax=Gonium pectorale TaxID=33097 RepID=A0A150H5A5_GONPE|nr:hypothetical protein GPECTOR_1g92 [Gonium pectorale]|eukprot:KXZ57018.1 hypothetical protein GPECTOR_1g92 [Gonium pectorale]